MLIAIVFQGAAGDPNLVCTSDVGTADIVAASHALYGLASRLEEAWPVIGRRQHKAVTENGEPVAAAAPEDVLMTVSWSGRRPTVDHLTCTAPTPEQAHAAALGLEEMARHHMRRALTAMDVQAAQQQAARERLLARPAPGDLRKPH